MPSTTAQTTLSAKSTVGAGTTIDFATAVSHVSMVLSKTGTVTGGLVAVEASQDGTIWKRRHIVDVTATPVISCDFSSGAYRYWRGNVIKAILGGGSVTATLMEAG